MADPQIGPDPSAGSAPCLHPCASCLGFFICKKRLYFSLLICAPNPPRHPFFPYKAKKESPRCDSITCWWSSPIKIRTQRRLDLVKRDCLRSVLIVLGQDQFIIEHIHSIYKFINLEQPFCTVLDHVLELGAICCFYR